MDKHIDEFRNFQGNSWFCNKTQLKTIGRSVPLHRTQKTHTCSYISRAHTWSPRPMWVRSNLDEEHMHKLEKWHGASAISLIDNTMHYIVAHWEKTIQTYDFLGTWKLGLLNINWEALANEKCQLRSFRDCKGQLRGPANQSIHWEPLGPPNICWAALGNPSINCEAPDNPSMNY